MFDCAGVESIAITTYEHYVPPSGYREPRRGSGGIRDR